MNTPSLIGRARDVFRNMRDKIAPIGQSFATERARPAWAAEAVRDIGRRANELFDLNFLDSSWLNEISSGWLKDQKLLAVKRKQQQKSWDLLKDRLLQWQTIPEWTGETFLFRKSNTPVTFNRLRFDWKGKEFAIFEFKNEPDLTIKRRDIRHIQKLFHELPLVPEDKKELERSLPPQSPHPSEIRIINEEQQKHSWKMLWDAIRTKDVMALWNNKNFVLNNGKTRVLREIYYEFNFVYFWFQDGYRTSIDIDEPESLKYVFKQLPLTPEDELLEWDGMWQKNSSDSHTSVPTEPVVWGIDTGAGFLLLDREIHSPTAEEIDVVLDKALWADWRIRTTPKPQPKQEDTIQPIVEAPLLVPVKENTPVPVWVEENIPEQLPLPQIAAIEPLNEPRRGNTVRNTAIAFSMAISAILIGYTLPRGPKSQNISPVQTDSLSDNWEKNSTAVRDTPVSIPKEATPPQVFKPDSPKLIASEQKASLTSASLKQKTQVTPIMQASIDVVKPDVWKKITKWNTIWGICKKNKLPDEIWKNYKKHAVIIRKNGSIVFPVNAKKLPIWGVLAIRKTIIDPKEFTKSATLPHEASTSEKISSNAFIVAPLPTVSRVVESVKETQSIILNTSPVKTDEWSTPQPIQIPQKEPLSKIGLLTTHEESKEFLQKLIVEKKEWEAWKNKKIRLQDATNIQWRDVIFEKLTYIGETVRMKVHEWEKTFYIPVDMRNIDNHLLSLPAAPVAWKDLPDKSMERFSTFVDERLANMNKPAPPVKKETFWWKIKSFFS